MAKRKKISLKSLAPVLDVLALLSWGGLLLNYWSTGKLKILIHPNYFGLVLFTGLVLVILGCSKGWQLLKASRSRKTPRASQETIQHITLFPLGWGSSLLIVTALAGFLISPTVLASQMALQRGITENLPVTQEKAETFTANIKPEERSLIDWVRTLNAYPEPDAYEGQKAKVTGFVIYPPNLPKNYLLLSRFILTCCAVDAYPVGIPVRLNTNRESYPVDTWLQIEGTMTTATLPSMSQTGSEEIIQKRQLVLVANSIKKIPTPSDPYSYVQ